MKIHWKQCESLCTSKLDGGLGFRSSEAFNMALLGNQWWRIISRPDSLVNKVLKGRYFMRTDPMKVGLRSNASFLWRSFASWANGGSKVLSLDGCRWLGYLFSQ